MSVRTISVLRHAQSVYNVSKADPDYDSALTEKGREQASQVTGDFDLVICSPMSRCRDTLKLSQITYKKLIICPEARELLETISDFLPGEELVYETVEQLLARIEKLKEILADLLKTEKGKVLLVAHHDLIFHMTSNGENSGIKLQNAELREIELSL